MSKHKRLIDLSTWTPDQRRQADVMVALDVWTSRTCGPWVEDGFAAIKTDTDFGQDMMLDFACHCMEEHLLSLGLPCLFVDEYRDVRFKQRARDRIEDLLHRIDRQYGGPLDTPELTTLEPPFGRPLEAIRFEAAGGFVVVQHRYVDAGVDVCGVDTWTLVGTAPRAGSTYIGAMVIGERSGEIVTLIMPVKYRNTDGEESIGDFSEPASALTAEGAKQP
jgi:hypothetical protein